MCSSPKNNKALGYALCLLKFRVRSEFELRQRLKRKSFDESTIGKTLISLREKGLVDDLEFSRIWVESRIKRPLGIRRIKQELKSKGIDRHLIEQVINNVSLGYNEGEVLFDLIQRRWEKLKHIEPAKAKRRLFLYLLRRGFSADLIRETIERI